MTSDATRRTRAWAIWGACMVALLASPALAQRVVVLDLAGDARGRIQAQLERELGREEGVTVLPHARFERRALRRGFRGARASTPEAVAAVGPALGVEVALLGRVERQLLRVRAVDAAGRELLVHGLPLRRGRVAGEDVARLVGALEAALRPPPPSARPSPPLRVEAPAPGLPGVVPAGSSGTGDVAPASGTWQASPAAARVPARPADAVEAPIPAPKAAEEEPPERERTPPEASRPSGLGPRPLTLVLAGTSTWRTYCAAPGVEACAEYATQAPAQRAAGRAIDFTTAIPYTGGTAQLELFPLALLGDSPLGGLGLLAEFGLGASAVAVNYQTEQGEVDGGVTQSADRRLSVMATYRHFFAFRGPQATLPGYVGMRAGYLARHFLVAREARAQLPSSRRGPLAAGLDVSVPLARLVRLEASGLFLLLPQPDAEVQQLFGEQVSSGGYGLELGVAGDITGPLGYQLRFRMLSFHDRFTGAGTEWLGGGVADEVYSGLNWGLTLAF